MENMIHRFFIFLALSLTLSGVMSCAMGGTEVGNPNPPSPTVNAPTGESPAADLQPETQPCDEENLPPTPEETGENI